MGELSLLLVCHVCHVEMWEGERHPFIPRLLQPATDLRIGFPHYQLQHSGHRAHPSPSVALWLEVRVTKPRSYEQKRAVPITHQTCSSMGREEMASLPPPVHQ